MEDNKRDQECTEDESSESTVEALEAKQSALRHRVGRAADKLENAITSSRPAKLTIGLGALLGAFYVYQTTADRVTEWYQTYFGWTDQVETALESLRADLRLDEFTRILGRPPRMSFSSKRLIFERKEKEDIELIAHVYQSRGYWVQAIVDELETVLRFTVTVCHEDLHPQWKLWDGGRYVTVILGKSKFVGPDIFAPRSVDWYISGATANSFINGFYSGGNATQYLTFHWGLNDICNFGDESTNWSSLINSEPEGKLSAEAIETLEKLTINSFGVTGARGSWEHDIKFQIGVDRVWVRTIAEDFE